MRKMYWAVVVATLLAAPASATPPLEAYGRLPTLENLTISPNGSTLAYVTTESDQRIVRVETIDDHRTLDQITVGFNKLRALDWADDRNLIITTSQTGGGWYGAQEFFQSVDFNVLTRQFANVLKKAEFASHFEAGLPQPRLVDGKLQIYVPGATLSGLYGVLTVFAFDPDSGNVTQLEAGTKYTEGFLVDDDGKVAAQVDYNGDTDHWSLLVHRGGNWVEAYGVDAKIETPALAGRGTDGKSVLIATIFDVTTGAATPLTLPNQVDGVIDDPLTHRLIGTFYVDDRFHYTFLDPADRAAWDSVLAAFPDENVQLDGWSEDRKRILVQVDGKRDGSVFEFVDLNTHRADLLGPVYAGIGPEDIAAVRWLSYPAADGLQIPAELTLPSGKPEKALPLIVMPHGGPAARDMPGFDWWAQALASRGYAVLQPQFRGSDGFGWQFLSAGFGQWGRKMQSDVSDGVRYLVEQGIVDPRRICIVGASYGGYAAMAGITLQHGVYRCAVSVGGVSDPMNIMSHDRGKGRAERYLERYFGVSGYDDRKLDEVAPLSHSGEADAPLLLIHGTHDTVVSYLQSQHMYDALKRDGKQADLVLLDSEDHWLSTTAMRQRMLAETVKFLEANDPPQ